MCEYRLIAQWLISGGALLGAVGALAAAGYLEKRLFEELRENANPPPGIALETYLARPDWFTPSGDRYRRLLIQRKWIAVLVLLSALPLHGLLNLVC